MTPPSPITECFTWPYHKHFCRRSTPATAFSWPPLSKDVAHSLRSSTVIMEIEDIARGVKAEWFRHVRAEGWFKGDDRNFLLDQLNRPAGECLIPEPARSNTIATIRYGFTHTFHKASDAWDGVAHEYSVFLQHCSERHRFIGLKLPNDLLERLNPFLQLYLLYEILYLKFAPLSPSPDYSMLPSMERAAEKIEAAARQVDVPPEIRGDLVSFASGPGHQLHVMMNLSDDDDP
ncbi:hypothetical protein NBRC10512_006734 [Rhodotorula toruloides]|uniref:Uncharacterized protein n=1 Tax=Rhodotorula toruloides (strain NP11) TaxID=1130832 RepID=M7X5I4_RHOT1|nr:uncharacterized protein RHTO_00029 [Rhodotorula toruloides NP11]EMS25601.1 hypothetical protein RHTO_00029 [Rhodotorula toruloides NP11]